MTVLTLLIPACSVRAVSACLYTVLIIPLSWLPPPQWTSFPKPSLPPEMFPTLPAVTCSFWHPFTHKHTQTHTLREWCQFGVLNESRRTIQHLGVLKLPITPCTYWVQDREKVICNHYSKIKGLSHVFFTFTQESVICYIGYCTLKSISLL